LEIYGGFFYQGITLTSHTAQNHPSNIAKECDNLQNKATSVSEVGLYFVFDYQVHNFKNIKLIEWLSTNFASDFPDYFQQVSKEVINRV